MTKTLICDCHLKFPVPHIGTKIRVLVVHLHPHVANKNTGFAIEHDDIPVWLSELILDFGVDILMGDFNMWLWKVIPELRRKKVVINLLAWFPWKAKDDGEAMCDSCGIFMCNVAPYEVKLLKNLDSLNWNDTGFFYNGFDVKGFAYIAKNAGPGHAFDKYLPKAATFFEKLFPSFTLLPQPSSEGKKGTGKKGKLTRKDTLNFRQSPMDVDLWLLNGENYKGSHFPVACFTDIYRRRSNEQFHKRWKESNAWKGFGKGQAEVAAQVGQPQTWSDDADGNVDNARSSTSSSRQQWNGTWSQREWQ